MRRVLSILLVGGISGCAIVGELWKLAGANILGIMPKEGFSDSASEDFGKVGSDNAVIGRVELDDVILHTSGADD